MNSIYFVFKVTHNYKNVNKQHENNKNKYIIMKTTLYKIKSIHINNMLIILNGEKLKNAGNICVESNLHKNLKKHNAT